MAVRQDYEIGADTMLSTHTQLAAVDAEWQWAYRTLSGFEDKDGRFIEPGGVTQFHTQRAEVSGVWILDKSQHPVKIYGIGHSGSLSIRLSEHNIELPLADYSSPYENSQEFILTAEGAISTDVYYAFSTNNRLSIELIPADGTSIKTISFGSYTVAGVNGTNLIHGVGWDNGSGWVAINDKTGFYMSQLQDGILVDFVEGGILTYNANKNSRNPRHPDLNN